MGIKVLDLFCGAGGASMGYYRAGFDVFGLDIKHGKRYPFRYIRKDFESLDESFLAEFDFIHASPPCQLFSSTRHLRNAQNKTSQKKDYVQQVRNLLIKSGKPFVIENVVGAPLVRPVMLCGSRFGLKVRRHRIFESNLVITGTRCDHKAQGRPVGIYGSMRDEIPNGGRTAKTMDEANEAMGIDWMIWSELVEAIPPIYTETIGKQIREQIWESKS